MIQEKNKKDKIIHRVRIIKGHVEAIEKMIASDEYCLDIVHQSLAVQKALKKLDEAIIEDHIRTCVVDQAKRGESEKIAKDLLGIYNYK